MKLKKYSGNPVLKPHGENRWENLVVCNPGAWYEDGVFYLLYRAAGEDEGHVIRFGLATSTDGYNFKREMNEPCFGPSLQGPDSGCTEDARIVKFDDYYYVTYAFRPYPPGQYWKFRHDEVQTPQVGENAPRFLKNNIANSALAMTKDFKNWIRLGRITQSGLDDRDVILFPEKINGKFAMLHRPKEWIGEKYGSDYPAVWIRFSDDILDWTEPSKVLIEGIPGSWEEKVGGSTPPIRTEKGWFALYHGVENGGNGYYRVGAVMLDLNDPSKVIARSKNFIMEPEFDYELDGFYNGCVFPTGNVVKDGILYVYYGGADKYIGLATADFNELTDKLLKGEL